MEISRVAHRDPSWPESVEIFDTTLRDGSQFEGIALTADDAGQVKQRCLEAGMDGVLCKPFDVQALGTVLKRHRGAVVPGAATHGTGWVAG